MDNLWHEWAIFHSYVKQLPHVKTEWRPRQSWRRGLNTPTREARGGMGHNSKQWVFRMKITVWSSKIGVEHVLSPWNGHEMLTCTSNMLDDLKHALKWYIMASELSWNVWGLESIDTSLALDQLDLHLDFCSFRPQMDLDPQKPHNVSFWARHQNTTKIVLVYHSILTSG